MADDVLQYRAKQFFEILRDNSRDKEDPVSEWDFVDVVDNDGTMHCICTAPIRYLYRIQNRFTGKSLIVGSECVKRWLNSLLRCERCNCRLGNITKRLRTQDFHCRACKQTIRWDHLGRVNHKLGSMRLFWYGPYYQREFREVINDIPYVETLLNVQNKTKTLELFEQYVNHVYDVTEV